MQVILVIILFLNDVEYIFLLFNLLSITSRMHDILSEELLELVITARTLPKSAL